MVTLFFFSGLLIVTGGIGFLVCESADSSRAALEYLMILVLGLYAIFVGKVSYNEGARQAYLFNEKSLDEKIVYEVVGEQYLFSQNEKGDKWLTSLMCDDWPVPRAYGFSEKLEFTRFVVFRNEYGQIEFLEYPKGSQPKEKPKPDGTPTIPESHSRRMQ